MHTHRDALFVWVKGKMEEKNKKVIVCRLGAIGDCVVTTPLISLLHSQGYEVFYLTSETGMQVLKNNPKITKLIQHVKDSIPSSKLGEYFQATTQAHECDHVIDLCESLEVNLALYPYDPRYKYTKYERKELCNRSYYEETVAIAMRQMPEFLSNKAGTLSMDEIHYNPEYYFSNDEDVAMRDFFHKYGGVFTVLIGLSGSARQKTFPYYKELIEALTREIPSIQFITVGDEPCQILEYNLTPIENVMCTSGIWSIRQSIHATKYASLVIAPDTGLLHGAGCFDTPKIGLLTNTSKENITKHFINDFSIESEGVGCAPCFKLIQDADTECNLGDNRACLCMSKGHSVERIVERVLEVFYKFPAKKVLELTNVL